jgi:hypothetical protein
VRAHRVSSPLSDSLSPFPRPLPRVKDYGWCKEHGIYNCPTCHPEVAQLKQTPTVTDADRQRAARALAATPRPENNPICRNYRRRITVSANVRNRDMGSFVAEARKKVAGQVQLPAGRYRVVGIVS